MLIIESIHKARVKGVTDEQILEEIMKQNPERGKVFSESIKKGIKATQIIDEIIKEQEKKEEERRIQEAKKRIEELKRITQEKKEAEIPISVVPELKIEEKPLQPTPPLKPIEIIRPVPKKLSLREKLWIRVSIFSLVLILLAGVGTFWYWYFIIRQQPPLPAGCTEDKDCPINYYCSLNKICVEKNVPKECNNDNDCPEKYVCGPEKTCIAEPDIHIPDSLFSVESTRTLTISQPDEFRPLLLQTIKEDQIVNEFKRVVIKNTSEKKVLNLRDFINALQIRVPVDIYQKLKEDEFTLFIYSQVQGNRIGFAVKVKEKQGLEDLLKTQEKTMKDDYKTFFSLMIEDKPPLSKVFKDAKQQYRTYEGHNFRFQTLTKDDVGIVYLVSDQYFVFTSSWDSMVKTITKLDIKPPLILLTKDLKYGMWDEEVKILQTFLAKDPAIYPEKQVTGLFGPATRRAVIRFQNKYATELLAPRGLTKGDGLVDVLVRTKINQFLSQPPSQ